MLSLLQAGIPGMERDTLSIAADVSLVLIGIFAIIGSLFAIWMMTKVGRLSRKIGQIGLRMSGKSDPLLEHGRGIAANVEFITAALRTDVQSLSSSVHALSDRLQQASDRMEERIEEFNALMEVVQGEAEEMFLDTASTVRGVQASAADLVGGGRRRRHSTELAEAEGRSMSAPPIVDGTAGDYDFDETDEGDRERGGSDDNAPPPGRGGRD